MGENRIPKRVLYMNLGTWLRGRPRNRWQDEVREDGWIDGGEGWQEKVHNREEWKKLLRTARNRHILHMAKEWRNELHEAASFLRNYQLLSYKFNLPPFYETCSFITILHKILSLVVPAHSHPGMCKTQAGMSPWPLHFAGWQLTFLGVSVWNLLHVTLWHLKTFVPLLPSIYLVHLSSIPTCILYPNRFLIKILCIFLMSDKWYMTNPLTNLAFLVKSRNYEATH